MPGMTPELLITLTDNYAAIAATLHDAHDALDAEVQAHKSAVVGTGDTKMILQLARHDSDFHRVLTGPSLCRTLLYRQMIDLGAPIRDAQITGASDLRSFAAYFNTGAGGPYQCLLSEGFADLYALLTTMTLSPADIRPPASASLGRRAFGGVFRHGKRVDQEKYAGYPRPAVTSEAATLTASRARGAGRVVVTGTARDQEGIVREDREWTAEITAHAAEESEGIPLTPAAEGDLLLHVTGITLPANLSAGELTVSGA